MVHSPQAALFYSRWAFSKCCSVSALPHTSVEPRGRQWDENLSAAHSTVPALSGPHCPLLPSDCSPTLSALLPLSNCESGSLILSGCYAALTGGTVILGGKTNNSQPKTHPKTVVSEPHAFTSEVICRLFYWYTREH